MLLYILYPLLFSLIPVLTFYNKNIGEAVFKDLIKLLAAVSFTITALFFLLTKVFNTAPDITSGIILYLLILFYTPAYKWKRFLSHYAYQYIIKYIIYAVLVYAVVYIDSFLPLMLTIIFAVVLFLNIIYSLNNSAKNNINIEPEVLNLNNIDENDKPDIYHIILDAYIGSKGISAVADFDNSTFYNDLKALGFNVYENVYSNYNHTVASIPSVFKMDYHEYKDIFETQIKNNRLMEMLYSTPVMSLKNAGYKTAGFSKWFFSPQNSWIYHNVIDKVISLTRSSNNDFFSNFFKMTLFGMFFLKLKSNTNHAKETIDSFNLLKEKLDINSPFYAFYHILAPHMPFSFHKDGSINNKYNELILYDNFQDELAQAYVNHTIYVNKLAIEALNQLIENIKKNNRKAVIFIHSDHGAERTPLYETRYNIILAEYKYGYDNNDKIFQDNMSLINVFPMLFNYIFKTNIKLKDNKFFDEHPYNYDTTDITDIINKFFTKDK